MRSHAGQRPAGAVPRDCGRLRVVRACGDAAISSACRRQSTFLIHARTGLLRPFRSAAAPRRQAGGVAVNWKKAPRTLVLTAGYVVLVHTAVAAALLLRFDDHVPAASLAAWARAAPAFTLLSLAAFWLAGLYHGLWRYAGTATVFQIARGVTLSAAAWGLLAAFGLGPAAGGFLHWFRERLDFFLEAFHLRADFLLKRLR